MSCVSSTSWASHQRLKQYIGGHPGGAQRTLVLDCQAGAAIAPDSAATCDMALTMPASAAPGDTKLGWKLEVPDGPVAGALVTVT